MSISTLGRDRRAALIGVLRLVGAALLAAVAVIHLHLWRQGYDGIHLIGPALLVDVVLGCGGALLVLVAPPHRLPAAAALGALLCAGTLGALLLSTSVGLFGFVESTKAQLWWESFWVEAACSVVLVTLAVTSRRR